MTAIGAPVRRERIVRRPVIQPVPVIEPVVKPAIHPEIEIISVPVRPSERAARRRKLWEGPKPEQVPEPVKVPEKVGE